MKKPLARHTPYAGLDQVNATYKHLEEDLAQALQEIPEGVNLGDIVMQLIYPPAPPDAIPYYSLHSRKGNRQYKKIYPYMGPGPSVLVLPYLHMFNVARKKEIKRRKKETQS